MTPKDQFPADWEPDQETISRASLPPEKEERELDPAWKELEGKKDRPKSLRNFEGVPILRSHTPLNRLTVRETIIHQADGQEVSFLEGKFESHLETSETAYRRPRGKVGEEWTPIDLGWLKNGEEDLSGVLVIQNNSGVGLQEIPTPEEAEEIKKKVIEIGMLLDNYEEAFTVIPPKEHVRFRVFPGTSYSLRSQSGEASYTLFIIPR